MILTAFFCFKFVRRFENINNYSCFSKNMKLSVVVFCLFVGLTVGHPSRRRTNHRKLERNGEAERSPEKGRRPQKRELTEKQSEKMFFCHMVNLMIL